MKKYGYQDLAKNPENNSFFVSSAEMLIWKSGTDSYKHQKYYS